MQLVRSGGGQRPPDFVVKLFLMFQEFPELIAWDSGKIVIPAPATKLGSVLSKFFRTGKGPSSTVRQMFVGCALSSFDETRTTREGGASHFSEKYLDHRRSSPSMSFLRG